MKLPTVAIVGRPNVGKSSIFNRILKRPFAVVDPTAGVTRDRNYATADWAGVSFYLIDTGGIVPDTGDLMDKAISDQADFAIGEADVVVLVVDTQVGVDNTDLDIARKLHRSGKPVILVANKVDSEKFDNDVFEFMKLGLDEPMPISATVGRGVGDMLDKLVSLLPESIDSDESDDSVIRVAVVGRPNVGKSSFINRLTGSERAIVTPIAGTTRDAVDTPFEFDGQKYVLVDTAGLRRRYKVHENIEFYTNVRTDRAIAACDVAVILIDAAEGLSTQDQRILDSVYSNRRSAVLAINKWDLIEKDSLTADRFARELTDQLARQSHLPIIFISALSGQRVIKVLPMVKEVYDEGRKRIGTAELNEFLEKIVAQKHPPAQQGKYIKLNYMTQTEVGPPTFVVFTNRPKLIAKSYISYIENQIRKQFGFAGVPFRLKFRQK